MDFWIAAVFSRQMTERIYIPTARCRILDEVYNENALTLDKKKAEG